MIWIIRVVIGTVVVGLLQLWGIIFAAGFCFVCDLAEAVRNSFRRMWGRHGKDD